MCIILGFVIFLWVQLLSLNSSANYLHLLVLICLEAILKISYGLAGVGS